MSKNENGTVHTSRLCHVIKVEDFDGYGFNLHAEKGKQGQYIGKVDDGSPAERAGLKQGDRIIEVNGVNIGNETHKQVVQRIKAIASEVQLLVVDPSVPVNKDNRIVEQTNGSSTKIGVDTPDNVNSKIKTTPPSSPINNSSKPSPDIVIQTVSTPSSPKDPKDDYSVRSGNSSTSTPPVSIETNETRSMTASPQSVTTRTPEPVKTPEQNGSSTKSHGLNLNMTAAELRAKLAAKKKFDPKNDSVDLRKKFEIVQKL